MAVRKNNKKAEAPEKDVKNVQAPARQRSASQAELRDKEAHDKAVSGFHPEVVKFFGEKLGLNLDSLKTATLYDILQGKLSEPLEIVVTPLAFDREADKRVEMPRIKSVSSIRVVLPMENGKPVAPDKDHPVFIQTVPCRPFIEKSEVPESSLGAGKPEVERELPTFTDAQLLALEGIGIDRSRMFGGFNHLTKEQKCDIAEGKPFMVDGAVKTEFGLVNVIGQGRLSTDKDGKAVAMFESTYPEARDASKVIDLMDARRVGTLELDFMRRNNDGRVITNVNGAPILNEAGANIVNYGMAMEPVKGYIHKHEYDNKAKKFVDKVETGWYQVTAVNGNLFATRMKEVKVQGIDGAEIVRTEIAQARVKDGKVFVNGKPGEPLEFASDRDLTDFLAGRGGVVKNAVHHDFKLKKDVTYDAFVVPDNTKAGFARQFTPETSKKLIERRDRKVTAGKKQNFGIGM